MIFERIGASHPLFEASFTLYEASFPPNERRTREDHLRALQDEDFFPLGAVEDGKLLADVFLWETEDFYYLEHFAVQPSLRGHGTGSTLLRQLLQREKPLILEDRAAGGRDYLPPQAFLRAKRPVCAAVWPCAASVSGRRSHCSACHHVKPESKRAAVPRISTISAEPCRPVHAVPENA